MQDTLSGDLYAYLVEAIYVHEPEARQGAHWVMNPEWLSECRQMTDGEGFPVWHPSMSLAGPDVLLGFPIEVRKDGGAPHLEPKEAG